MRAAVAPWPKLIVEAPELIKLNDVDVVFRLTKMFGVFWKTTPPVPVGSVRIPLNWVEVVDENEPRVSDLNATSPPSLKSTLTAEALLSLVKMKSLLKSTSFVSLILRTELAVEVISKPFSEVAVATPNTGEDNVGDCNVLFVRIL